MTELLGFAKHRTLPGAVLLATVAVLFASVGRAQDGDAGASRRDAVLACIASNVQAGIAPTVAAAVCMADVDALERLASGQAIAANGVDVRAIEAAARGVTRGDTLINAGAAVADACAGGDPHRSTGDEDEMDDLDIGRGGGGSSTTGSAANYQDSTGAQFYCDTSGCTRVGHAYDQDSVDSELTIERRTAGNDSCKQVVTQAALLLAECNRTEWKPEACQSLAARMGECPDPGKIYVDADAGYVCGVEAVSPERVQEAFTLACEKRMRPGPDSDPCRAPEIKGSERGWPTADGKDICRNPSPTRPTMCASRRFPIRPTSSQAATGMRFSPFICRSSAGRARSCPEAAPCRRRAQIAPSARAADA